MKILKVIHGYPDRYNAGSETYSQILCHELVEQGHEVRVFSRCENAYLQEYSMTVEKDTQDPRIQLHLINMTHSKDGYRHVHVDRAFASLLESFEPDVVHIGHLNHLSTSIVQVAHDSGIPVVFTLHDFWLMCPRGQFLQAIASKNTPMYPVCDKQDDRTCARQCYWRYFSSQSDEEDIDYWTRWVEKRMQHVQEMSQLVDQFIAPSKYLMDRFINDFDVPSEKIEYLDYGFNLERLVGRKRDVSDEFVFGYIGTHKQAKGIAHLLEAFNAVASGARLKIWGSPLSPFTQSLKMMVEKFDRDVQGRIEWMGGYDNTRIVPDVFNEVDAIVVPSIWGENSPLVIHEALQAKVPVITADYGGMKEYIAHEVNGLLFRHRDPKSLAHQMKRFVKDPKFAKSLTERGYLQSECGTIPNIHEHTRLVTKMYERLTQKRHYGKGRPLAYHL